MSDWILIDGDRAEFAPNFAAAVVAVRPGKLEASGPATRDGNRLCVDGDEQRLRVSGCTYVTPAFPVPGVGILEISALAADQRARKTTSGDQPVLLLGSRFTARFTVSSPAFFPLGPIPDPTPSYPGEGRFVTTNKKFRGT